MQSPQEQKFAPPPPVYSIPPRSSSFPLWGKIFLGCGCLGAVLVLLVGVGLTRLLARGRGAVQTQFCFQNLRTAQRAMDLYSQDYDQTLPQAATWMDTTIPYMNNQQIELRCPVVRVVNPKAYGYAFDSKLSGARTAKIESPAVSALVFDSTNLERNASNALTSFPSPPRHANPRTKETRSAAKNGNLVVYADGHVGFVAQDGTAVALPNSSMRNPFFFRPQRKR